MQSRTSAIGTCRAIKLMLRLAAKQWEADIAWAVLESLMCLEYSDCVAGPWSQRAEEAQPLCHHRQRLSPLGLRSARLLGFVALFVQMPDPRVGGGAAAGLLEPVEHLGGRVDLVVVLAIWKHCQLVQVFGKPCRLFRQVDKPFSIIAVWACMRMILSDCGW